MCRCLDESDAVRLISRAIPRIRDPRNFANLSVVPRLLATPRTAIPGGGPASSLDPRAAARPAKRPRRAERSPSPPPRTTAARGGRPPPRHPHCTANPCGGGGRRPVEWGRPPEGVWGPRGDCAAGKGKKAARPRPAESGDDSDPRRRRRGSGGGAAAPSPPPRIGSRITGRPRSGPIRLADRSRPHQRRGRRRRRREGQEGAAASAQRGARGGVTGPWCAGDSPTHSVE